MPHPIAIPTGPDAENIAIKPNDKFSLILLLAKFIPYL